MIQIVALVAKAGHGKTTVANYLWKHYGARPVSLATPLKKIAQAVMGFSHEQLWGTQAQKEEIDPRYGMSPRIFLQKLGTEGIRENLGRDVWLQALIHNVLRMHESDGDSVFVVDDARFVNEVSFFEALNGKRFPHTERENEQHTVFGGVVKIICQDAPASGNDAHPSEAEIDKIYRPNRTVTSSRALGQTHLIGEVERLLNEPHMRDLRAALNTQVDAHNHAIGF